MDKIIVSDKLYVPADCVSEKRVEKHYTKSFFSDFGCRSCDFRSQRPVDQCKSCENFGGHYQLACKRVIGNIEYIGLPLGDRDNIEENMRIDFNDFKIVDRRCKEPFDYKVKMDLGEDRDWFDHQIKTVDKMKKHKFGLFILPPRSGKSLTALKMAIELGYKVLLIADQYDFLNQFIGDIKESTNLPALEKKTGKKLYGFIKTKKDLKDIQIGIITYQSLINENGRKLLKACNKTFGTIIVDEVQSTGAPEFSDLMNRTKMKYRFGCTGTWIRKDGKHIITKLVMGPPKSEIKRAQMTAKLLVVDTKFKSKGAFKGKVGFTFLGKALAKNPKRNDFMLEWILKDLEAGHSIVIPMYFKEHIEEMVRRVNSAVGYEVAAAFTGGGTSPKKNKERRDWIKAQASQRKIRVVIGIRKLLQRGINIKPWSCLYYVMPMNNEPNWKQETSRILTPDPDKRQPIIRFFADGGCNASLKYFQNTFNQAVAFNHVPTDTAVQRFRDLTKNLKRDISDEDAFEQMDAEAETSLVGRKPPGGMFGGLASSILKGRGAKKEEKKAKWKKRK